MKNACLAAVLPVLLLVPLLPAGRSATPSAVGPPGLCFPFVIGEARALQWGGKGAFDVDPDYERTRIVDDVLELVGSSDDVLARAESLRRAVIYLSSGKGRAWEEARLARSELVSRLRARVLEAELAEAEGRAEPRDRALRWLDLGYALGALDQAGLSADGSALPALGRAFDLAPGDGELALAAYLASHTRDSDSRLRARYLQAAVLSEHDEQGRLRKNFQATLYPLLGVRSHDALVEKVRRGHEDA